MKICVIGSGYVGLVTSVCLADTGHIVVGVDIDEDKVTRLNSGDPLIYERGLGELLKANLSAGRLRFTSDQAEAADAQIVFLAIGTPPKADGSADLSVLEAVAVELAGNIVSDAIIVIKSTVPVGTGDLVEALMRSHGAASVKLVSNPEFLKEGTAVDDFMRPDRVVIGFEDQRAGETVRRLYEPFVRNQKPILMMRRRAAEMTKYAANAYLAGRISFMNEIANICERMRIDVNEVRVGMGTDSRIGTHFLYPGCGYGGSCFPKDVTALAAFARQVEYDPVLISAVHEVNERQKLVLFDKICRRFENVLAQRRIGVWGGAFKPTTDDIREAPALLLIDALLAGGASVQIHDPQALHNLQQRYGQRIQCCPDAYEATKSAHALVVVTEWNEFRSPDFPRLRELMAEPIIFDGRNLYEPQILREQGFEYYPIGRPAVTAGS